MKFWKLAPILIFALTVIQMTLNSRQSVLAQNETPTVLATVTSTPALPTQTPTVTPVAEVRILEAQLEVLRQSEDRLLNTVLWALGGVFTLAVGIVFYNGFIVSRNYEREKALLLAELQDVLRKEMSELHIKAQAAIKEQQATFETSTTTKLDERSEALTKEIRHLNSQTAKQLKGEINKIKEDIFETQFKMLEREMEDKFKRGFIGSAISDCCALIKIAQQIPLVGEYKIRDVLDRLQEILKNKDELSTDTIRDVTITVGALPNEYDAVKKIIDKLLIE